MLDTVEFPFARKFISSGTLTSVDLSTLKRIHRCRRRFASGYELVQ